MQYLAERTRQALGLGDRDFHPTSLEAEHRAVHEASVYGHQLHTLERSLAKWSAGTEELLNTAGRFLEDAPRPRHFTQYDPSDAGTLTAGPPALPPQFEQLNQPSLVRRLAAGTPLAVNDMLRLGLEEPMAVWLAAMDAAKERLSGLERLRIRQDAARRALHAAARAPGADEVGHAAHEQLIKLEQEHEPVMSEFRDAHEALDRHLGWLVDQAARIKAAVVAGVQAVNTAALRGALVPPEGLLLDFPLDLLAATAAAIAASGLDVPPPQLVMLGPDVPEGAEAAAAGGVGGGGGVTDVMLVVPPGTAGVAAEAALQAAEAVGAAAAQDTVLSAPRVLREQERVEERLLHSAATGGPAAARLHKLVTQADRRDAVRGAWRVLVHRAMESERDKSLAEHAEEQMRDVKERAGLTGGFLMRPEAAPEYVMAGRRRLPGGGPLQFLRDTLLGPPTAELKAGGGAAAAAAGAGGSTGGVGSARGAAAMPTATAPSPVAASAAVDYAAAAREQMEEVATHGTGGAGATGAALMSPTDTGVGRFVQETVTGPREKETAGGGGGGGVGGFVSETLTGPSRAAAEAARDTAELPFTSGGTALPAATTADLAAAAREQMHDVATQGTGGADAAAAPPPPPAEGRTVSGGPATFAVDTLMGPQPMMEPGPGSYMPPPPPPPPPPPGLVVGVPVPYPLPTVPPTTLAAAVPVPMETYEGGGATPREYPEVPYGTPASTSPSPSSLAAAQAAERADAAFIAADAAMDVSAASAEAAGAAAEAAAVAVAAAAAAMEAATDARVAAIEAEAVEYGTTEMPPGGTEGTPHAITATEADGAHTYGMIGAGGPPGPSRGSVSDEVAMAAGSGAAAADVGEATPGGAGGAGGVPLEALDLPDFSKLDVAKHGRCGVPTELPQYAKQYGKVGAGGPPGGGVGGSSPSSESGEETPVPLPPVEQETSTKPAAASSTAVHPGYEAFSEMDVTSFGLPPEGAAAAGGPTASMVAAMAEPLPPHGLPEVPADVGPTAIAEQLGKMHLESFGVKPAEGAEAAAPAVAEAPVEERGAGEEGAAGTEGTAAGGGRSGGGVPGVFGALKKMVEAEVGQEVHGKAAEARGQVLAEEPAGPTAVDA